MWRPVDGLTEYETSEIGQPHSAGAGGAPKQLESALDVHSVALRQHSGCLFDDDPTVEGSLQLLSQLLATLDAPLLQQTDRGHIG